MRSIEIIEAQIKQIEKVLISGKAKNVYAAKNKIRQLEKELREAKWNHYLAV